MQLRRVVVADLQALVPMWCPATPPLSEHPIIGKRTKAQKVVWWIVLAVLAVFGLFVINVLFRSRHNF
jgi:hypothetical protein